MTNILTYPPLRPSRYFESVEDHLAYYPNNEKLRAVYTSTGYPDTRQGRATATAALRGSTAAFYTDAGFRFRHPKSDIDIIAITTFASTRGARYLFYEVKNLAPIPRALDVLCFTSERLRIEQANPHRIFLMTKLVQPGLPIFAASEYEAHKVSSLATLIIRGVARGALHQGNSALTPSGAAQLIIEENLFAEPWRWHSLYTYYLDSPNSLLNRDLLSYFCHCALQQLADQGMAQEISGALRATDESIYQVDPGPLQYRNPVVDRIHTYWGFVYDQFSILLRSGYQSINFDNVIRILMKTRSLLDNPLLRYDADVIFG